MGYCLYKLILIVSFVLADLADFADLFANAAFLLGDYRRFRRLT
jgi:hypothetical protein